MNELPCIELAKTYLLHQHGMARKSTTGAHSLVWHSRILKSIGRTAMVDIHIRAHGVGGVTNDPSNVNPTSITDCSVVH